MDELTVISRARRLLETHRIIQVPVDIVAIAEDEGLEVRESEKLEAGVAGMLVPRGDRKVIFVNKHDHPYRRRFTIAHELAHHVLKLPSVHGARVPSDELERYGKRPREEILCDLFAAECLVPWKHIQHHANSLPFTVETITQLSDDFEASKPCMASRFAQASSEHLAYVLVEDGVVRNVVRSVSLRESGVWVDIGAQVPVGSAVRKAMESGTAVEVVDLDGTDWSYSDAAGDFACHEESLHIGTWSHGIALLTFEEVDGRCRSNASQAERDEDDERLSPLTGHLSWNKR